MKKIFWLLSLLLISAMPVYADCNGGTEVTGKNGHVYCKSNITMNWYTAFMWCNAQGRTLATIEQICDIDETQRWDGTSGEGKCLNIVGASKSEDVWSALPAGSPNASFVNLSTGFMGFHFNRSNPRAALCW